MPKPTPKSSRTTPPRHVQRRTLQATKANLDRGCAVGGLGRDPDSNLAGPAGDSAGAGAAGGALLRAAVTPTALVGTLLVSALLLAVRAVPALVKRLLPERFGARCH